MASMDSHLPVEVPATQIEDVALRLPVAGSPPDRSRLREVLVSSCYGAHDGMLWSLGQNDNTGEVWVNCRGGFTGVDVWYGPGDASLAPVAPADIPPPTRRSRFAWWHAGVAFVLWACAAVLMLWAVAMGLDDAAEQPRTVAATVAGVALGPMTGAISRGFQDCCLAFSLSLLPYCLAALAVAVGVQLALPPSPAWLGPVRLLAWIVGLVVWFGGGLLSLLHALS